MTDKPLPNFRKSNFTYAEAYAERVFNEQLIVVQRMEPEHYFRAIFATAYFTIQPGNDTPSKSQWNTLKKRLKRINPTVFVLKEYGTTDYNGTIHSYIDFGFLPD